MSDQASHLPPEDGAPEDELVPVDDRIIRKAFWISLGAFAACGVLLALTVVILTPRPTAVVIAEAPVAPPRAEHHTATAPVVPFTDITAAAGIDFVHENGARGAKLLPETMGAGCAFLDYDGDGDPDILLANARPWPGEEAPGIPLPTPALYRNEGGGRFRDVTQEAGLAVPLYGMGIAVGDYDGDGRPDVFLSALGANRLLHNEGGRFRDVTASAGVAGGEDTWSTSAGFLDHDGDGDLDLFVCNYVRWSRAIDEAVDYQLTGVGRAYGPPKNFEGTQPYFYRNEGGGRFREVAAEVGLHVTNPATGAPIAKALALVLLDPDRDGDVDVMVANDTVRNFYFQNLGDGTFREDALGLGVAYDSDGSATGAMGIDAAYFRGDETLGIGIGNFATEMSSLYVSEGARPLFSDQAITEGIGPASRKMLSFGLFFLDYDLDGRPDLFQTNGHLEEEINTVQPSQHYQQPSQLFWNGGPASGGTFVPVEAGSSGDLDRPIVGRGAAYADVDGDGDLDLLITQTAGPPLLLRNDQALGHGWLRLRLVGRKANRDAIGALVEVEAGGVTQRQLVTPTRSYLSQVEPVLTFGLGLEEAATAVRITWPGDPHPQELGSMPAGTDRVVEQP